MAFVLVDVLDDFDMKHCAAAWIKWMLGDVCSMGVDVLQVDMLVDFEVAGTRACSTCGR